jgi:protein tyrosine/serine phosphatase
MAKAWVYLVVVVCASAGCRNTACLHDPRPVAWAAPAQEEKIDSRLNLYKVDAALYRGAQPSAEQFKALKAMGVKTVVNLRESGTDEPVCRELGLNYVAIPMTVLSAREEHILAFLKVMSDPTNYPVYVHCKHGADRTGLMCAMYRVTAQGWEKDEAIRELTEGGYNFMSLCQNLVSMVQGCDTGRLRQLAGLAAPTEVASGGPAAPVALP